MCTFINAWPNQKLLGYSIRQLWRDILPSLLTSVLMGGAVYGAGRMFPRGILGLTVQVGAGVVLYLLLSLLFKLDSFQYLLGIVKEKAGAR